MRKLKEKSKVLYFVLRGLIFGALILLTCYLAGVVLKPSIIFIGILLGFFMGGYGKKWRKYFFPPLLMILVYLTLSKLWVHFVGYSIF